MRNKNISVTDSVENIITEPVDARERWRLYMYNTFYIES